MRSLLLGLAFLPSEKEESQIVARALDLSSRCDYYKIRICRYFGHHILQNRIRTIPTQQTKTLHRLGTHGFRNQ